MNLDTKVPISSHPKFSIVTIKLPFSSHSIPHYPVVSNWKQHYIIVAAENCVHFLSTSMTTSFNIPTSDSKGMFKRWHRAVATSYLNPLEYKYKCHYITTETICRFLLCFLGSLSFIICFPRCVTDCTCYACLFPYSSFKIILSEWYSPH